MSLSGTASCTGVIEVGRIQKKISVLSCVRFYDSSSILLLLFLLLKRKFRVRGALLQIPQFDTYSLLHFLKVALPLSVESSLAWRRKNMKFSKLSQQYLFTAQLLLALMKQTGLWMPRTSYECSSCHFIVQRVSLFQTE